MEVQVNAESNIIDKELDIAEAVLDVEKLAKLNNQKVNILFVATSKQLKHVFSGDIFLCIYNRY